VRVVTWNLQHGVPDPKGPADLARGIEPLRTLAGDVYALQELDRGRWRTRGVDQPAILATALEGELVWARAKHRLWGAQCNALVVRGEVVTSEVLLLPGGGERRVAALALVVAGGRRWSVATTHLSLDRSTAQGQLRSALRALDEWPGPRVLLGDLNLMPHQVEPLAAEAGYDLLAGDFTVNARTDPDRRLDHVLLDGLTATDSGVDKLPLSDHLAVWADLA